MYMRMVCLLTFLKRYAGQGQILYQLMLVSKEARECAVQCSGERLNAVSNERSKWPRRDQGGGKAKAGAEGKTRMKEDL